MNLATRFKSEARRLGFSLAGICPAVTPTGIHHFQEWLRRGYHGEMRYLSERADAYAHPSSILDGVRSLLMLGMRYPGDPSGAAPRAEVRVARYAQGPIDYHDLIHGRLKQLVAWLRTESPGCAARGVVDTAPLLEREFAQLAGLGWIGKNTLLLHREHGSWFFLAAILTDLELEPDDPFTADHCGSCTACLEACPTQAFPQPRVLDATRCISYLTIELRDEIPAALRPMVGDWVFGCDICQSVCPWNRRVPESVEPSFEPSDRWSHLRLENLFELTDETFRELFRKTPLWRAKRRGLLRNAAIALGNRLSTATAVPPSREGSPASGEDAFQPAITALCRGLRDVEPLVQSASAWALEQLRTPAAETALRRWHEEQAAEKS